MSASGIATPNLYVHFPFCRRKCAYCALHSSAGSTSAMRADHVAKAVAAVRATQILNSNTPAIKQSNNQTIKQLNTVYFGGGTPALCDLRPFKGLFRDAVEFTVELHPLDVTDAKLDELKSIGVNRISLGVQSFCDSTLASMGRLHSSEEAVRAFRKIRAAGFSNSGLDLIVGWPGDRGSLDSVRRATDLGAVYVSVYTLIVEPGTPLAVKAMSSEMPSDDAMLDTISEVRGILADAGIVRYEISNYAKPGFECRHNLAVWRGEDYLGIGPGAHSRVGHERWRVDYEEDGAEWRRADVVSLDALEDARERALFSLRLAEGIDLARAADLLSPSSAEPEARRQVEQWMTTLDSWRSRLDVLAGHGIVRRLSSSRYALTNRGMEVCDAVAAELPG